MIETSRRVILKKECLELVESKTRIGTTFFVYKNDEKGRFESLEAFDNYSDAHDLFYKLFLNIRINSKTRAE